MTKIDVTGLPKKMDPVSPGELLWEEFMMPMGLTRYRVAKEIGVPPQRIGDIVSGKRSISADTDLRLCTFFGLSAGYFLEPSLHVMWKVPRRKCTVNWLASHRGNTRFPNTA